MRGISRDRKALELIEKHMLQCRRRRRIVCSRGPVFNEWQMVKNPIGFSWKALIGLADAIPAHCVKESNQNSAGVYIDACFVLGWRGN